MNKLDNDDLIKAVSESLEARTIKITDIPELKRLVDQAIQTSVNKYTAINFNSFNIQQQLKSLVDEATQEQVDRKSDIINGNNQILVQEQERTQQKLKKINHELVKTQKENEVAKRQAHELQNDINELNKKFLTTQQHLKNQNKAIDHYDKLVNYRYFIFALVLFAMIVGIVIGVVFL